MSMPNVLDVTGAVLFCCRLWVITVIVLFRRRLWVVAVVVFCRCLWVVALSGRYTVGAVGKQYGLTTATAEKWWLSHTSVGKRCWHDWTLGLKQPMSVNFFKGYWFARHQSFLQVVTAR
jgi:hypothetical protein